MPTAIQMRAPLFAADASGVELSDGDVSLASPPPLKKKKFLVLGCGIFFLLLLAVAVIVATVMKGGGGGEGGERQEKEELFALNEVRANPNDFAHSCDLDRDCKDMVSRHVITLQLVSLVASKSYFPSDPCTLS